MTKITRFIIVFLVSLFLSSGLFAANSDKFAIENHNKLQATYVKAIIDDDKDLIVATLNKLIVSSKKLGLNYDIYEKELKNYKPVSNKSTKNKPMQKAQAKEKAVSIIKISSTKDSFILHFDRKLNKDEFKTFDLNLKKVNRKIYDIKGILRVKLPKNNFKIIDEIKVAQFDKQTIRVVFLSPKKINLSANIVGSNMVFKNLNKNYVRSKTTKKQSKTRKKARTKSNNKIIPGFVRSSKIIVLDAGHGGKDGGAHSHKIREKDVVLKIALKTGKILKSRGYKVYYTRANDKFVKLRNRTAYANHKKADLFISVHANAAPNAKKAKKMQGVETFFLSPARSERSMRAAALENKAETDEMNFFTKTSFLNFLNREKIIASNKLAIDIQSNILKTLKPKYKVVDGGVREAPFWVLVGALMPAILIEVGYITHPVERQRMTSNNYITLISTGIANGVDSYFYKNH